MLSGILVKIKYFLMYIVRARKSYTNQLLFKREKQVIKLLSLNLRKHVNYNMKIIIVAVVSKCGPSMNHDFQYSVLYILSLPEDGLTLQLAFDLSEAV